MPTHRSAARLAATSAAALVAGLLAAPPALADHGQPVISEMDYQNPGTDTEERIELQAPAGFDLSGWSVVLYNGSSTIRAPYRTTTLDAVVDDSGTYVITYGSANSFQNGDPDGVALVDASGDVVEFLSYGGTFTALSGPAEGTESVDIGVTDDDAAGSSVQRDSADHTGWYGPVANTFGSLNGGAPAEPDPATCDTAVTNEIPEVQGSGSATPLAGQLVTVRGVVTADLQEGNFDGFHLQDPTGDGNPATSDAVFVSASDGPDVSVGDVVVVTGTAGESNGLTQISADSFVACGTAALPAPAELDLPASPDEFEALEAMRVTVVDELTVTEVYNLNRFGEVMLSEGGRLIIPTEVVEPGTDEYYDYVAENRSRMVILDDGRNYNLASAGEAPPYLELEDPVRVGDTLATLEDVVLSYGFGSWRLQPTDGVGDESTFAPTNPRPEAPEEVGGDLTVAAFNVLNYFVTFGDDARGAPNEDELAEQEAKIVAAILGLDADVIALQEIENSAVTTPEDPYRALRTLVDALNDAEGKRVWRYVEASEASDVITNAIIYRVDRVTPVGEPMVPEEDDVWDNAREPIAQTFRAKGDTFTVIGNHFKSKGSGSGANADQGDGQGASNLDRVLQAEALVEFAAQIAEATGDDDVLLLGDFNAYRLEDPIDAINEAGYVDLNPVLNPGDYTYVFSGESGSLDHAFASEAMFDKITGVDVWNINAVESYAYQYNGYPGLYDDDPYRASDHDPILVGVDLRPDGKTSAPGQVKKNRP